MKKIKYISGKIIHISELPSAVNDRWKFNNFSWIVNWEKSQISSPALMIKKVTYISDKISFQQSYLLQILNFG